MTHIPMMRLLNEFLVEMEWTRVRVLTHLPCRWQPLRQVLRRNGVDPSKGIDTINSVERHLGCPKGRNGVDPSKGIDTGFSFCRRLDITLRRNGVDPSKGIDTTKATAKIQRLFCCCFFVLIILNEKES